VVTNYYFHITIFSKNILSFMFLHSFIQSVLYQQFQKISNVEITKNNIQYQLLPHFVKILWNLSHFILVSVPALFFIDLFAFLLCFFLHVGMNERIRTKPGKMSNLLHFLLFSIPVFLTRCKICPKRYAKLDSHGRRQLGAERAWLPLDFQTWYKDSR